MWIALISISGPIGGIISFVVPVLALKNPKGDIIDPEFIKKRTFLYLSAEAALVCLVCLLTAIFFRDPNTEPKALDSKSEGSNSGEEIEVKFEDLNSRLNEENKSEGNQLGINDINNKDEASNLKTQN